MENTLRQIETEDIVIYKQFCYSANVIEMTKRFVEDLIRDGVIVKGSFDDDTWICYSGVKNFEISFDFDKSVYEKHIGKEFGISYEIMKRMIKCYVAYCTGEYIFGTLAREVTNKIKEFLCCYKNREFRLTSTERYYVENFLAFINTPEPMIDDVLANIRKKELRKRSVRTLSPLINYLVIENEINEMFSGAISDEEFIKYFPIYFWVNITFILPLRATEMLVTPFDCIVINDNEITLKVRRTILKGGKHRVYYDVDRDYEIFTYHLRGIIKKQVFEIIQRYQEMTKEHKRRFLFDYGATFTNEMLSLPGFNNLIKVFMDDRVMGNLQYEYAKRVSGLDEFEYVTAGDSRPIAMANLYFQDAGADICRQLANHMNITTSESYFTNVSETLYYSSIMQMQNRINKEFSDEKVNKSDLVVKDRFGCTSPKRLNDKSDIEDCKGHYEDCFGCKYYFPNDKEIKEHMENRKEKFEYYVKKMQSVLTSSNKIRGKDIDTDELFLWVHTTSVRYKESTDVYAEKEAEKWVGQQTSQMIYC